MPPIAGCPDLLAASPTPPGFLARYSPRYPAHLSAADIPAAAGLPPPRISALPAVVFLWPAVGCADSARCPAAHRLGWFGKSPPHAADFSLRGTAPSALGSGA